MHGTIKKYQAGFTLLETIIYTAIIGIVVSAFVSFTLSVSAIRNKNYAVWETQSNSRIALNYISEQIRSSSKVNSPVFGEKSAVLSLLDYGTGENLRFFTQGGILYFERGSQAPEAISSPETIVRFLEFANYAREGERDNIGIILELDYYLDGSPDFSFSTRLETAAQSRL